MKKPRKPFWVWMKYHLFHPDLPVERIEFPVEFYIDHPKPMSMSRKPARAK